jgi:hypothetical protein
MSAINEIHLNNPQGQRKILEKMMQSSQGGAEFTTEDHAQFVAGLEAAAENRKTPPFSKTVRQNIPFTPKGEGKSGHPKVPLLVTQSKSPFGPEDAVDDRSDHEDADNDPSERGGVEGHLGVKGDPSKSQTVIPLRSVTVSTDVDARLSEVEVTMSELSEGMDMVLSDQAKTQAREFGEIRAQVDALRFDLNKVITALTTRVNDVEIKYRELANRPAVTTFTASRESKTGEGTSQTTPVSTVAEKRLSFTQAPSAKTHASAISSLLSTTPVYPKVKAIRSAKMSRLAAELGFRSPASDIVPNDWNIDGIMRHLTKEKDL